MCTRKRKCEFFSSDPTPAGTVAGDGSSLPVGRFLRWKMESLPPTRYLKFPVLVPLLSLVATLALQCLPAAALADKVSATVTVVRTAALPRFEDFVDQVRIEFSGSVWNIATKDSKSGVEGDSLEDLIASPQQSQGGLLVWVQQTDDHYSLYVIGQKKGRSLVESFPVEGDANERNRAMALKLHEVADSIIATGEAASWIADTDAGETIKEWGVGIGGNISAFPDAGAQFGAGLLIDRYLLNIGLWRLRSNFTLGWEQGLSKSNAAGNIETKELAGSLGAQLTRSMGNLELGGIVSVGLSRWFVDGESSTGETGDVQVWIPTMGVGGVAEKAWQGGIFLRAVAGWQFHLATKRFFADDSVVLKTGIGHVSGQILVGFRFH